MEASAFQALRARENRLLSATVGGILVVALVVFVLAALVAVLLPYGEWDAMAYGTWSRLIAEHWPQLRFADADPFEYQRPFFFFLQGTAWAIFGFHQALGRLVNLAFSVLLAVALGYLGLRSPRKHGVLCGALAVGLLVTVIPFERYIAAGLTDVPAAAMLAATAALFYAKRLGRAQLPVIALVACLTQLTKPSAFVSLCGLAAAALIGSRAGLRGRVSLAGAAVAGMCVAFVYDEIQARYLHMSFKTFLTKGTDGFYASQAAHQRADMLLGTTWLGNDLRILMVFALVYAVIRVAGLAHRPSVVAALVSALCWSWIAPQHGGISGGIVAGTSSRAQEVGVLVLAASLLLALRATDDSVPSRLDLGRLLIWLIPPFVVWTVYAARDVRLLSPAWPPLVLLMARALLPAFTGARRLRPWAAVIPAAGLLLLAALSTEQLNGFGSSGWHEFRSGFGNTVAMQALALGGDFNAELVTLRPQVRPSDKIVTADGRLPFLYPGQVAVSPPVTCGQLRASGATIFVLLESDEEQILYGPKASSAYWETCKPALTLVGERPGAFAIFTTGAPTSAVGGCGAPPMTPGIAVEFGRFHTSGAAGKLLAQARSVGFVQAKVEQLGCSLYRVAETGIPSQSVAQGIVAEAKSAHLKTSVVTSG
ncbi:MAG TPA: hypothetical protein VF091_07045 [Gaiellaceae bacterium]